MTTRHYEAELSDDAWTSPQRRRMLRLLFWGFNLGTLSVAGYLVDTVGEGTMRVRGVVEDVSRTQLPEETRYGTRSRSVCHSRISIPGKVFWWNECYRVGASVGVHVMDGRFTGWRYIDFVESPALTDFNDADEAYQELVKDLDY